KECVRRRWAQEGNPPRPLCSGRVPHACWTRGEEASRRKLITLLARRPTRLDNAEQGDGRGGVAATRKAAAIAAAAGVPRANWPAPDAQGDHRPAELTLPQWDTTRCAGRHANVDFAAPAGGSHLPRGQVGAGRR